MATDTQAPVSELESPGGGTAAIEAPTKIEKPKKDAKSSKKQKASTEDKGKKGEPPAPDGPSVAGHPRAAHQVARAKAWGGLVGFMLGGYLSLPTHTFVETGLRALVAGVVCYLVAWAAAVFVWRHLVVLEIKSREQELLRTAHADPAALAATQLPAEQPRARTAS